MTLSGNTEIAIGISRAMGDNSMVAVEDITEASRSPLVSVWHAPQLSCADCVIAGVRCGSSWDTSQHAIPQVPLEWPAKAGASGQRQKVIASPPGTIATLATRASISMRM